jgi:transposase
MALRRSPKPGRLDRTDLQHALQPVDHQRRQGLAFDVFGDDQQRLAHLGDLFQQRQHLAQVGDLLLVQQDIGVFQTASSVSGLVMK